MRRSFANRWALVALLVLLSSSQAVAQRRARPPQRDTAAAAETINGKKVQEISDKAA